MRRLVLLAVGTHHFVQQATSASGYVLRRWIGEGWEKSLFQHEKLDPVFVFDGRQCVDIFFEALPGRLFFCRMGQPSFVMFHKVVICHSAFMGEHVLANRFKGEFGRHDFFILCLFSSHFSLDVITAVMITWKFLKGNPNGW